MPPKKIIVDTKINAELNSEIPIASDEITSITGLGTPNINTDIPIAGTEETARIEQPIVNINTDIPIAGDTYGSATKINTNLSTEFPIAPDTLVQAIETRAELVSDFPVAESVPLERFELSTAKGRWLPKGDAIAIGAENFSELENFRYTDFGLEGVGGFTEINTSEHLGTTDFTNGIQLKTNYDTNGDGINDSHVLMQGTYSGTRYIITHDGNVPDASNFNFYITADVNDTLNFTSNEGGPSDITITPKAYTGITLAAEIETRLNDNNTLTGTGTITFEVTFSGGRFTIDASDGGTAIKINDSESNAADSIGFTEDQGGVGIDKIYSDTLVSNILYTENASAGVARMSQLPNKNIGICDGVDDLIWAGDEMPISAFLESVNNTYANTEDLPDYTNIVTNNNTTSYVTVKALADSSYLIGAIRPLSGIYINVGTVNTGTPSTMTVYYYTGADTISTELMKVDGTSDGTVTLAHDGWVTWTPPPGDKPYYISGYYLYFYRILISKIANSPTIINITARSEMRNIVDLWDGIYRTCIYALRHDDSLEAPAPKNIEYTLEVSDVSYSYLDEDFANSSSVQGIPLTSGGASGDFTTSDYLYFMFDEPIIGLKFVLKGNSGSNQHVKVYYTSGVTGTWAQVDVRRDSTKQIGGSASFNRSGFVVWDDDITDERKVTINSITGYAYKIMTSNDIKNTYLYIDAVYGIPKGRVVNNNYVFPFQYKNRAMWCGSQADKEYNRVDYSKANAPDVYNGEDASGYFNERSLYFGGSGALTCAVELFNQYGQDVFTAALFFKNTEAYMLTGDMPEDFRILPISHSIGCPAPLTITSAEVSYKALDAPAQNVAIWLSDKGPMMFISNTIHAIPGVEDPTYQEWNLLVPIKVNGAAQSINNTWLVYDLRRSKWYQKTLDDKFPQGAFPVQDQYGINYIYGFDNGGFLLRMEDGLAWGTGGSTIQNKVTTSDFFFTNSTWDRTRIRRLTSMFKTDTAGDVTVKYYRNTKTDYETVSALPDTNVMSLTYHRVRHLISYLNLTAWTHRLSYLFNNCSSLKPVFLGLSLMWERDTEELTNMIEIGDDNDVMKFISDQGSADIDVGDGLYSIDVAVQVLQDAMNADNTLTGTGTISFVCSINSDRKLVIDAGTDHTIDYTHTGSTGGTTWGFTGNADEAQTITANNPIA